MHARQRDDAQIDVATVDCEADTAVLGQAPLGDVQLGHDLHARDDPGGHAPRDGGYVLQDAVDTHPHAHLVTVGGEMHVGGATLDRLSDDLVDELDDRRVVGGLAQVDDLGAALLALLGALSSRDDVLQTRPCARSDRRSHRGRRPPRAPHSRS